MNILEDPCREKVEQSPYRIVHSLRKTIISINACHDSNAHTGTSNASAVNVIHIEDNTLINLRIGTIGEECKKNMNSTVFNILDVERHLTTNVIGYYSKYDQPYSRRSSWY